MPRWTNQIGGRADKAAPKDYGHDEMSFLAGFSIGIGFGIVALLIVEHTTDTGSGKK